MLFSSIPFLYYFLPCVLLVYFPAPRWAKNAVLLLASLLFYAWGEPRCVRWMLLAIAVGYGSGLLIQRFRARPRLARLILILAVGADLSLLGFFKYADFFLENFNAVTGASVPLLKIALPIGISFYTFQLLSYTVDVYRGDVAAQKNPIDLAAYVAFFPQLIAGPIVRYADIAAQLRSRTHSVDRAAQGMGRFLAGLGKKVLIANLLGELCADFRAAEDPSVLFFWLYAAACSLHIYFDFSGYSDMAIGLGKLFGFDFLENFDHPFVSGSITEFWRRWHMSLGSWFRDYVYIPLGGNRAAPLRRVCNILVVWLLTGFWHGAAWNFIVWGLYFALLLMLEKWLLLPWLKAHPALSRLYVAVLVAVSFVLFDAASVTEGFARIAAMFGGGGYALTSAETLYCLKNYAVVLLAAVVGATPLPARLWDRACAARPGLMALLRPLALAALLLVCTAYLVDGSYNPFLYFRF